MVEEARMMLSVVHQMLTMLKWVFIWVRFSCYGVTLIMTKSTVQSHGTDHETLKSLFLPSVAQTYLDIEIRIQQKIEEKAIRARCFDTHCKDEA